MAYLSGFYERQADSAHNAGPVIAGTWPEWERTSPKVQTPSPYALAMAGYRRNELVYSCVQFKAAVISEPPLMVYRGKGAERKALPDHPLSRLLRRPNPQMGTVEFLKAIQIYRDIAGTAWFECEFSNAGQPVALWPGRPDYSQYLRGQNLPVEKIRYIYPGFPVVDIPVERVLLLQEFDPVFPGVLGLSRSAVAARIVGVDNRATDFLDFFFQNGSMVPGILTTDQQLNPTEAQRLADEWQAKHGGPDKWGSVAVLGQGAKYQAQGMSFRDMDLSALDGRTEARICSVMRVSPILVGAKVGISATYSNYQEAQKAQYKHVALPDWAWLASEMTEQMLPWYGEVPGDSELCVDFDLSNVKELQDDRDAAANRAVSLYTSEIAELNEARAEAGLEPMEGGDRLKGGKAPGESNPVPPALAEFTGLPKEELDAREGEPEEPEEDDETEEPEEVETLKAYRASAIAALRGGQSLPIPPNGQRAAVIANALNSAKSAQQVRDIFAAHWPGQSDMARLATAIEKAAAKL